MSKYNQILIRDAKTDNSSDINKIINIINETKNNTNTLLIPYEYIVKEAINNGFDDRKDVFNVIKTLSKDRKLHILNFGKYHGHGKKYAFKELVEGIEEKMYIIVENDLQDVYKEIANKILID